MNVHAMALDSSDRRHRHLLVGGLILVTGLLGFVNQFQIMWQMWTSDALRSIGIVIPPLSLWLAWKGYRAQDWQSGGSWWGLPLVTVAMIMAMLVEFAGTTAILTVDFSEQSIAFIPLVLVPCGLLLFCYLSGAVLLIGGTRAWRRLWFPLVLWLLVDPVPHGFQSLVDLPSQALGARVARSFAELISVPVDGEALKLMFSPQLGIFIAPGCNGLRGAVTLGLLGLVVGYLYRMRTGVWVLYTATAVLLAYVFNLIRLCAVIGYYWFALRIPMLGRYGEEIDYVIGGTLFFGIACLVLTLPRRRWFAPLLKTEPS
jgi:exosortase J